MGTNVTLGVSGWRLHGQRTGVGRYLLNLVEHWTPGVVSGRFAQIRLYTPHPLDRGEINLPEHVQEVVRNSRLPMIPWDNLRIGPSARETVMLYPSYSRPAISRGATVVVVHDATMRLHPELFTKRDQRIYDPLYGWSARAATLVIMTTEAAGQDIARVWNVHPSRIRVTHLASAPCFTPLPDSVDRRALRQRLTGADSPFFFFAGKISGRRNVPLMLEALSELRRQFDVPHRLVLVGPGAAMREIRAMADTLGIGPHVVTLTFVSDVELNQLYNCAEALVMPSAYETVSFPIMEAQAAGTPVICIDTPGAREMTGGEAILMPALDVRQLVAAMAMLAADPGARAKFSRRGLANARRFSWDRCATETLDICTEAIALAARRR